MTVKFSKDHEWINAADANAAVVGITVHAQDALGDVVFVDLPEVGATFNQGDVAGVVESVKAAADVYMPVTGEIVEVNSVGSPSTTPWLKNIRSSMMVPSSVSSRP